MTFPSVWPGRALLGAVMTAALLLQNQLLCLAQAADANPQAAQKAYVLHYGDALNVYLLRTDAPLLSGRDPYLLERQPIRPDGTISVPLLGEMRAGGLTVPQFTTQLIGAYKRFFVDPKVVVNVAIFRPLQISVLGRVNRPNKYEVGEPIHLTQAIALANGLDHDRGDPTNVLVLRANGDRKVVNLNSLLDGDVSQDIMLGDGDTVRVAEVSSPDWYRLLPTAATVVSTAATLGILLLQLPRSTAGK